MANSRAGGSAKKPASTRSAPPEAPPQKPAGPGGLDLFAAFLSRFNRFGWDIAGILLVGAGVLTLLGVLGLTRGEWISPWVDFIYRLVGWGSILVVLALMGGGLVALRHRSFKGVPFHLGRVLALEGAAFTGLALLSILSRASFDQVNAGLDRGGLVGWGLAKLIYLLVGPTWQVVTTALILITFLILASGMPAWLVRMVDRRLLPGGASNPPAPAPAAARQPAPQAGTVKPTVPASAGSPASLEPLKGHPAPAVRGSTPATRNLNAPAPAAGKPVPPPPRDERLPPLNLLIGEQSVKPDERVINQTAGLIEQTLGEFGVPVTVKGFRIGPTVTQFAVEPGFVEKPGPDGMPQQQKVRVAQISALAKDLALALSAERLRIEAPVPGQSYVGIEVPNNRSTVVRLRPILEAEAFYKLSSPLAVALGRDVSGQPVVADLARMPHLLIAGTTGSGKSVCIAALTACLAVNNTPADLRLVMIDPKMVELVRFNGIPHILGKVETQLERILAVLRWAMAEMDHRYRLLEGAHTRDISTYNRKMEKRKQPILPRIVLMIDELADLMMTSPDETEHSLVRLAQMARATGIHLVVATQRPSTDVVTGLIKANFPARISFTVASSIDSRVILDSTGAETLLGRGDMLFLNPESGTPLRAQGVMVTDQEVERVLTFWQKMSPPGEPEPAPWEELLNQNDDMGDKLVERATQVVKSERRASASLLQRRLRIGYPRAARLIDQLEELGVVGPSQGGGRDREVLIEPDDQGDEGPEDGSGDRDQSA